MHPISSLYLERTGSFFKGRSGKNAFKAGIGLGVT